MPFDWLSRRWVLWLVPTLAIGLSALIYLLDPPPLQTARHAVFDQFQRWQPRVYKPAPVRIIDIDDESLRRLGQWPWPRTRVAELIERLQAAKASAIALDILFAEPDRTSPAAMLELWQPPPGLARQISALPDHDAVMVDAVSRGRVVLGFTLNRQPRDGELLPVSKASFVARNQPVQPYLHDFSGSVSALPALINAAQGNGAISFVPDADGVVRRLPLLVRHGDILLPSLSVEALRVAQEVQNITTVTLPGVGLSELRVGRLKLPTTANGEVWLHYSEPVAGRYIPAWKVLSGATPAEELAGHILLLGSSAQGLLDLRFSALGAVIPGVEVHAQLLEQVLTGDGLQRPAWSSSLELLLLLLGGVLIGAVTLGTGALVSAGAFAALLALTGGLAWAAFSGYGLLLDPVAPGLSLGLTFVLTSIVRHTRTEHRQRWIRQAFSRYVSPNFVEHLVAHPEEVALGGQRQECSFIFTDLEDFTQLIEQIDPGEAVPMINRYLDGMIAIVFAHHGTLTRIVGDGIAVLFSAPVHQANHPLLAVQCAMAMQKFAHRYASELRAQGVAFGETRMGVHAGEVIVGNFGGATILDYRALGDPINTASRLESANKYLGTRVCVSEAVHDACPAMPMRPIGRLLLKGKTQSLAVFEPLAAPAGPDTFYLQAYELMRSEANEALAAFEQLVAQRPADRLAAMHLARLRSGERGELIVLQNK